MSNHNRPILVFGATGQQGGSVSGALSNAGWRVRAFVRDRNGPKALALQANGIEVVQGVFAEPQTIRDAMSGVHGVFSVQPSSPGGTVTDEEEVGMGIAIADLAVEAGVSHLVYSSGGAVGDVPTGMGHFDSKAQIEAHVRQLPITATIVRPASFMEMLMMPGFGLDQGQFNFFMRPDQSMQFIAVADIGRFVAAIFANPAEFGGKTFEIASDRVTGGELQALFSRTAGRPIAYQRFPEEVLAGNAFLAKLTALFDAGRLSGKADLEKLRVINPQMTTFAHWLETDGRELFRQALGTSGSWEYADRV
ncbi:NmrA/HSCARG family protein [Phyllobacterium sp. 0TCS1.6C]|uniref:NmrA/HSCARG family protein n=1 Tax=unclassified Phyllobacterium TaxID=2638441 RepID=UPI0022643B5C|nr:MULTISPECIES: NmrA/HSCARG family protein [unclassified Phyllobacterium]MCX8279882.1 NmrA/HSCARG family protein [Phyllobacterium sp. 0TCS1.6C]MCX8295514.1 NmrA/HSCARG family protein [Phyllobacterium sp. 0TCS1.6A]